MERFDVINPTGITLHSGILQLTKDQAAARALSLNDLGKNLYEITKPVQFKRGEQFGYDGPLPKSFVNQIKSVKTTSKKTED